MHLKNRIYNPHQPQKYRRLSKDDAQIWEDYLIKFKPDYIKIEYDLPICTTEMINRVMKGNYEQAYLHLTNKRIDVLGHTRSHIDLYEIKPRANSHALGQVLTYSYLYNHQFKPNVPLNLIVLSNYCTEIDFKCFSHFKIKLICMKDIQPAPANPKKNYL